MKLAVDEKYIDFEDLDVCLSRVQSLLRILQENYFERSEESVIKEPCLLTMGYQKYADLLSASIGALQEAQEISSIVEKNSKINIAN